ncbi:FAD/NAD(P)-binding domain-containing protein [Xylaria telfairii]|nr:FAD/NAD(P)-binding domain-containing protein [Xylaria telfairii]
MIVPLPLSRTTTLGPKFTQIPISNPPRAAIPTTTTIATATANPTAGIVGAGLAGLSAAIALRRAGFQVQVYERSLFKNENGAAITTPPDAVRILRQWDPDLDCARPVPNVCMRHIAANTLQPTFESRYENDTVKMGAPCLSFHRVDLHERLKYLAAAPSGLWERRSGGVEDKPVAIRLGCEVLHVDCDKGILTLADGSRVQKDLVIIADGAHSKILPDFCGFPPQVQPTGRSIYRWLIPMDKVDLDIKKAFGGQLEGFIGWIDPKKNVFWVAYACSGGTVLSNAVVHDTEEHVLSQSSSSESIAYKRTDRVKLNEVERMSWSTPATKDAVLGTCSNFHPFIRRLVSLASEDGIKVHRLFKRPPLDSFVRGRTAIIGDAAHVMMPTHAAGFAMAVESAGVLEALFKELGDHALGSLAKPLEREMFINERLRLFDELRIPKCNLAMLLSNAGPEGLSYPGVEAEIRRFYRGPLPPKDAMPWSAEFRKLLFKYDAFAEVEKKLRDKAKRKKEAARDLAVTVRPKGS